MMGMMMLTFILFFAFVVNTGMLVNAKINLQNAADLAAYAGAAVQARQLTSISFLNYEMRRQLKKFLFRYYVVGNMAQKTHPTSAVVAPREWKPDTASTFSYNVPVVCIIFNSNDNYCQLVKLPKIAPPAQTFLDSVQDTLREQMKSLEEIRQQKCFQIGATNVQVLLYWLWNTDPELKNLEADLVGDQLSTIQTVRGLVAGLGLVPRELILKQRIDTLQYYVNFEAQRSVTKGKADSLAVNGDRAARERTLQAFYSAYYTLGEHTFDVAESEDNIVMDELLPSGGEGTSLLALKPIVMDFQTYAINFVEDPNDPGTEGKDCTPVLNAYPVQGNVPVGVYKEPSVLTYYAIRLTAKAKVMFSPFGDMTLKAYAAAQPFGSRIGPKLTESDFARSGVSIDSSLMRTTYNSIFDEATIPNLPVKEKDGTGTGQGWDSQEVIYHMYTQLGVGGSTAITSANLSRAYQAAMAPNPWESGKYNIPDGLPPDDPFFKAVDAKHMHAIWAPLVSIDKQKSAEQEIKGMIEELLQAPEGQTSSRLGDIAEIKNGLSKGITEYVAKLRQGAGEDGEGYNIARITDPFYTRPDSNTGAASIIGLDATVMIKEASKARTSWDAIRDKDLQTGRTGYSVKLTSFNHLLNPVSSSDGAGTTWRNTPSGDGESDTDMPLLDH